MESNLEKIKDQRKKLLKQEQDLYQEYYDLYIYNTTTKEWILENRYMIKDDRVWFGIVASIIGCQSRAIKFKIEYNRILKKKS